MIIIFIILFTLCRDVAMAIIKSNQMVQALRNTSPQGNVMITPMRRIIKKMPGNYNNIIII